MTTAEERPTGSGDWGQELGYPDWIEGLLPAMHGGFNAMNKYISVPALRAGLGSFISNPLTGYLMVLRTRGRKSGEMRDAPLGYTIVGEYVYCIAGFGSKTHWYRNVLADPHVEVTLPGRSFSGVAEEVTDADERTRVLAPLLRSMGAIAAMLGMGNPWRDTPEQIAAKCEGMPLVRIRATGIAAGPEDPGGWFWVVPIVASGVLLMAWRGRRRKACCGSRD
ncbi:MAG: nitroreductase/quinone reductase family protein [Candidatus Limnocylindrales bacterium]